MRDLGTSVRHLFVLGCFGTIGTFGGDLTNDANAPHSRPAYTAPPPPFVTLTRHVLHAMLQADRVQNEF